VTAHETTPPYLIDRATPWEALPAYLTVAELQAYLQIGRSAAYDYARVHGVRIGDRIVRVPREALRG
jgi:hypothetical protein